MPPLVLRLSLTLTLIAATAQAQEQRPPETVGTLDFFGLRRLAESDIRAKLKLKEGDPVPRAEIRAIVAELETIPGVQKASLTPITVDGSGKLKVFVGIQEEGAPGFVFRAPPTGAQRLPEDMKQIYADFGKALGPAVRRGGNPDDYSQGHTLNKDPDMRKAQDAAVVALQTHTAVVQEVLRFSASADDRRAASWLLGYAPDKKRITADLVDAARDPDATVRNNATRALGAIAPYAAANPSLGIRIDPTVFIEMIGSVTWTDLNKGSFLLDGLTKSASPELLRTLRARALPELIAMARWKSEGHAYPAIRILGRIAGWKDDETMRAWRGGGVEKIIAAAQAVK